MVRGRRSALPKLTRRVIFVRMIQRALISVLKKHTTWFPVVSVSGPRQSGKTTLAQLAFPENPYVNLEQASTIDLLKQDPQAFLDNLLRKGTPILIDEAQRWPDLFSWMQVISDREGRNGLFVITGSQTLRFCDPVS